MMMNANEKRTIIASHKMFSLISAPTSCMTTLQIMGDKLSKGQMDAEDCAEIVSAVFDKAKYDQVNSMADDMRGGNIDPLDELMNSLLGDIDN